jgi:lipoprotein-anchoring transpeptidase ErfK/SrfK
VAIIASIGIVLVLSAQLVLQGYYADKILPGVSVAGQDIGSLTVAKARAKIFEITRNYRLKFSIDNQQFSATSADVGLSYAVEDTVKAAYAAHRDFLLPTSVVKLPLNYSVDNDRLALYTSGIAERIGTQAKDATLVVKGTDIQVVPDQNGWSIDPAHLTRLIKADAAAPSVAAIKLSATQQPAIILASSVTPTIKQANRIMAVPLTLTYQDRTFTPSAAEIGSWLTFNKQTESDSSKLVAEVDISRIRGYVQQVAGSVNVAPVDKKITIESGVTKVGREGVDGLAIDQDPAVAAIESAVNSQQALVFTLTTHVVAFQTISTTLVSLDYGRYVEINLSKQHLWVWQDHAVIYDTPITSGATGAGFPTATGLFSIYYKATDTHLRGYAYGPRYNYDVHVNYWMPFYSGFGMHDASWRNGNFGGPDYYYGGSHGCVNLPDDAAAFIYNWAAVGTPVWVHL